MITLLIITDGRWEYFERSLESLLENLRPWPDHVIIVDDSGDPAYRDDYLLSTGFKVVSHEKRLGLGKTLLHAWQLGLASGASYIFQAEDDFIYEDRVNLLEMTAIMVANPRLAQLALQRQPLNADELAAGSIFRQPEMFWLVYPKHIEHKNFFTYNPCLIPRKVLKEFVGYEGPGLEQDVRDYLLPLGYTFGYVGGLEDPPRIFHIGETHAPGYRW